MTEPTMTPDSPSATDWQERAKQLEGWLNAAADAVGGCDLDMVASAIKVRLQSSPQPAPETDAPDFLAVVRKFYNENGYPDDMALAVGLEGCVGLAKQMYELGRSQATDATRVRDAALEKALRLIQHEAAFAIADSADGCGVGWKRIEREARAALADTGKDDK